MEKRNKRTFIYLIISLLLILLGAVMASMIQTNFYSIKVFTEQIETEPVTSKGIALYKTTGKRSISVADIYKPNLASSEKKVPLIFVMPGIQRTKETQASFCIELARRGYAVICIDPYAQGESTSSYESQSATNEGYGLFSWIDYVFDNLNDKFNYIDSEKIGACGHSAGGNACQKLAEREGRIAIENKKASRVKSVYITGYIREFTWKTTLCNVGISYSINDEGAFQNATHKLKVSINEKLQKGETITEKEQWWLTVGDSDLRYADESIALVNYQLKRAETNTISEVKIGEDYGNPYKNTYVVINNEEALHSFQPYDSSTLEHMLSFFDYTLDNETKIKANNQIWWFKEIGCGMALIGGFMLTLVMLTILLNTKLFASLKKPIPERTGNQKIKGRIFFWVTFIISSFLACYVYMIAVKGSVNMFKDAYTGTQTWFFPQRFTNAVMLWAATNGLIGILLFFLTMLIEYLIDKRRIKNNDLEIIALNDSYKNKLLPLKLSFKDLLKTLLLAVILILIFFGSDYLVYLIFHIDYRFMFISARVTFNYRVILATLMYLPIFFIFYFSNSLRVNSSMRPQNWSEGLSKVIAVLGNTLGLVAILFIEYIPMIQNGTIGYTSIEGPQWLFVNSLFTIIPMMFILPLINRYCFNKTGRSYLGPIVTCVIFIAMSSAATTIYYAL